MKDNVTILGTGAYGIALAKMFHENKQRITMWTRFIEEKNTLLETRENKKVLPGVIIDPEIKIIGNLEKAVKNADILVIAVPSGAVRELMEEVKNYLRERTIVVIAAKGIDNKTGKFMSEIVEKYVSKEKIVVISGPSFAIDVVSKQPTGLTIASENKSSMRRVAKALQNRYLRLVPSRDILGVEVCGSVKNIMAIASGMLYGFNANESCNAMFLTEAMHEIKNLLKELGCNDRTVLSYAGIGDLLLTCTSSKSRNFTFGYKLVKEKDTVAEYRKNTTIEGLYTLESIKKLIQRKEIDMPIINVIDSIVNKAENPKKLLKYLIKKAI